MPKQAPLIKLVWCLLWLFVLIPSGEQTAHASDQDRGRRMGGNEIIKALTGQTFMGNVGLLQMPIRAFVDPNKTFKMSISVDWVDRRDNDKKKTQVLDESGSWWIKGNLACLKFEKRLLGATDCFQVYRTAKTLRFYFDNCTMISTDYCQTKDIAFEAELAKGNTILPPTPPEWVLRCTAGCRRE